MRRATWIVAAATSLLTLVSASFVINDGQLSITAGSGISTATIKFQESGVTSRQEWPVNKTDTITLGFTLLETTQATPKPEPVVPSQVSVLATGSDTGRSYVVGIKVKKSSGKARWELDLLRASPSFLNLSPLGKIQLELLIAGSEHASDAIRVSIASLKLDQSIILPFPYWNTPDGKAPPHLELEKYAVQPELHWTFQTPHKPINPLLSIIFTVIVLSPWLGLLLAWQKIASSYRDSGFTLFSTSSTSTSTFLFLLSVTGEELLIFTYWIGLKIYVFLPLASLLAIPLLLTGRSALRQLKSVRRSNPIVTRPPTIVGVKNTSTMAKKIANKTD